MSLETVNFEHFKLHPGDRVLDLGCGEGRHSITAYLKQQVNVVGLDLSIADMKTARQRLNDFEVTEDGRALNFVRASGLRMPFADQQFDKVICSEVLEHIADFQGVLAEINRVLKPGGLFAVSVPRFGPEWICWQLSDAYHEVEGGHIRIFKQGDLQRAVEKFNMHRYAKHWAHGLHSPYWWLRCLFWADGEDAWLVRKYHELLVWDLMQQPPVTRMLERLLNPIWGKSVVMYFVKGNSRDF